MFGQMLHQAEKEGQIVPVHPFFVKRQDEGSATGAKQEVGVFDPLGDALIAQELAEIVIGQEVGEFRLGNVGIDGHRFCPQATPLTKAMSALVRGVSRKERMTGKSSFSSAV